jgi:hypothetical protein
MIFSKGDVNSIRMIRTVLTKFQDLSGLYPNSKKSDIFLGGALNMTGNKLFVFLSLERGSSL